MTKGQKALSHRINWKTRCFVRGGGDNPIVSLKISTWRRVVKNGTVPSFLGIFRRTPSSMKDGSETQSKLAAGASQDWRAINIRRISVESELSVGNWSPTTFRRGDHSSPFTIRPGRFPFRDPLSLWVLSLDTGTIRARTRSLRRFA